MKIPASTVNAVPHQSTVNIDKDAFANPFNESAVQTKLDQGEERWQHAKKDSAKLEFLPPEEVKLLATEQIQHVMQRQDRAANAFTKMEIGLQQVIAQISMEHPELLSKEFDLTRTMDGMEVVDHNLTDAEYNYVKHLANSNKDLLEGSDAFNQEVAEQKTSLWYQSQGSANKGPIYEKSDVAGRVKIMAFRENLLKHVWQLGGDTNKDRDRAFAHNYQNRERSVLDKEMMNSIQLGFKALT